MIMQTTHHPHGQHTMCTVCQHLGSETQRNFRKQTKTCSWLNTDSGLQNSKQTDQLTILSVARLISNCPSAHGHKLITTWPIGHAHALTHDYLISFNLYWKLIHLIKWTLVVCRSYTAVDALANIVEMSTSSFAIRQSCYLWWCICLQGPLLIWNKRLTTTTS